MPAAPSRPAADPPILLVEDKDSLRTMLRRALEAQGHQVLEARDEPEAVEALRTSWPALVLSDLRLPKGDGIGVLRAAKSLDPAMPVIVMTAFGSIQDAVSAMKEGALDFLAKPVDPDHLLLTVGRALAQRRLAAENILLKEELAARRGAPQIVGDDPRLKQVIASLQRASASDTTVLLEGESGTGKELFARTLHALSPRAAGPFIAINCAAIPATLLETELFGYEKGAFTGAQDRKKGRFEVAQGGTLFLDEIGDIPLSTQVKLLRVLQEREFDRLGGTEVVKVNVRLVAATNKDMEQAIAHGTFREDLFYRLNVFAIFIPPLRERKPDVLLLADHFLQKFASEHGKDIRRISTPAIDMLTAYHWPGNVRELQNVMERAVLVCDGQVVHAHHLPPTLQTAEASGTAMNVSLAEATAAYERDLIQDALKSARGNRAKAARLLRATDRIFNYKVRQLGIDWKRFK
jgi:DNA-binding NtrC family response regulator